MEQEAKKWIKSMEKLGVDERDFERSLAYARDLLHGLHTIRTYPQGVTVFGSARVTEKDRFYKKARLLGQLLAQNGHAVITGGGPGIMEAANRGAFEYGGRSIGLNITLEHEQFANPYLTDTMEFHYFFARKVMLTMSSKVYAFFPGGFGTLDELSEIMVLIQENKMPKVPVFFVGKNYWAPLVRLYRTRMLKNGMIKASDLKLFKATDRVEDIVAAANRIGHPKIGENYYDTFKH